MLAVYPLDNAVSISVCTPSSRKLGDSRYAVHVEERDRSGKEGRKKGARGVRIVERGEMGRCQGKWDGEMGRCQGNGTVSGTNGMKLSHFSAQMMAFRGRKPRFGWPPIPYLHAIRVRYFFRIRLLGIDDFWSRSPSAGFPAYLSPLRGLALCRALAPTVAALRSQ